MRAKHCTNNYNLLIAIIYKEKGPPYNAIMYYSPIEDKVNLQMNIYHVICKMVQKYFSVYFNNAARHKMCR